VDRHDDHDEHGLRDRPAGAKPPEARWRVAAVALAGLPTLLTTPLPDGFVATRVGYAQVAKNAVAEAQLPDIAHWADFVSTSGIGVTLVGIVVVLPGPWSRRLAPWAIAIMALLGLFMGYAAVSLDPAQVVYGPPPAPALGFLLAAVALFFGTYRTAGSRGRRSG
jgi:hypothetical protein